jgi:ABC-type lipoprotein export system ATPase subunit
MKPVLECRRLSKTYGRECLAQVVLSNIDAQLHTGQICAVLGPSGSGKTTLLSIIGCLLSPTTGEIVIDGRAVDFRRNSQLTALRRTRLGFVFQHAQLLPFMKVRDNLRIVGANCGVPAAQLDRRIAEVVSRLGIESVLGKKPARISGGERQRVAIARAVLHKPLILLADEPTAALDWNTGRAAVELLVEQARAQQSLLITVTHDTRLLDLFERVFYIDSGNLVER